MGLVQLEPVAELPLLKSLSSASFIKSAKSAALDTRRSCGTSIGCQHLGCSAFMICCIPGDAMCHNPALVPCMKRP